jgi:parallel beta-helix repeat protein
MVIKMKKIIILGIIGALFLSNLMVANVLGKDPIKNLSDGDILYVGGAGVGNFSTIHKAVENATDGDTVFVFGNENIYYENFVIDKSIDLIGEDKATVIIDGSFVNDIVTVTSDYVNISGFTIQNASMYGILLMANHTSITNNMILNSFIAGISLRGANNCKISRNKILQNCHGIQLKDSYNNNDNLISDNIIKDNFGWGLYLSDAHGNTIYRNIFDSNIDTGVRLWSSGNNQFYFNNFINNGENINVSNDNQNVWDNGEVGNYWDDYSGVDFDEDGVGDTPYVIKNGDNDDNYPLMEPVSPELEIMIKRGLRYGLYVSFENKGRGFAYDVEYEISITGGILGLINTTDKGVIQHIDTDNEEIVFVSTSGIGLINIKVNAGSTSEEDYGLVLGKYVFIPYFYKISPREKNYVI